MDKSQVKGFNKENYDREFIAFPDNIYAVRFKFHVVTNMSLWQALPNDFKREITKKGQQIKFAEETFETAKSKRADCSEIKRCFPIETSMLERLLNELTLNDYVIFKAQ